MLPPSSGWYLADKQNCPYEIKKITLVITETQFLIRCRLHMKLSLHSNRAEAGGNKVL